MKKERILQKVRNAVNKKLTKEDVDELYDHILETLLKQQEEKSKKYSINIESIKPGNNDKEENIDLNEEKEFVTIKKDSFKNEEEILKNEKANLEETKLKDTKLEDKEPVRKRAKANHKITSEQIKDAKEINEKIIEEKNEEKIINAQIKNGNEKNEKIIQEKIIQEKEINDIKNNKKNNIVKIKHAPKGMEITDFLFKKSDKNIKEDDISIIRTSQDPSICELYKETASDDIKEITNSSKYNYEFKVKESEPFQNTNFQYKFDFTDNNGNKI